MMTAAMDMMQVESRINGVNEALTIAGAPFHVSPISVPKANVGEIPGFSTRTIPEDGLMHPIVYWDPKFEKLYEIICEKQREENNRVIIFSSFRHTLAYVRRNLEKRNIWRWFHLRKHHQEKCRK